MSDQDNDLSRRALLASTAALALVECAATSARAAPPPADDIPQGRMGDFNFLAGSWRIHHRMRKRGAWDEFSGEATCWTILGGMGSIEELRIPARDFSGLGLRLLDIERRVWNDFWVNAKSGVLTTPGTPGGFRNGVGTFVSEETEGGKLIKSRGVWDQITRTSHRWRQGTSRDGGKTWEDSWIMEWTRQ